jgi:hypothetical protein
MATSPLRIRLRTALILALIATASSSCFGGDKQQPSPTVGASASPLKVGDPRVMDYESGDHRTARIEVTPTRVVKGDIEDFKGVRLDARTKRSTPYYVTVSYENVGTTTLPSPSLSINLWARNASGKRAPKLTVIGALGPCENGDAPPSWKPGATLVDCSVFLLPKGEAPASVTWQSDPDQEPAKWTTA